MHHPAAHINPSYIQNMKNIPSLHVFYEDPIFHPKEKNNQTQIAMRRR